MQVLMWPHGKNTQSQRRTKHTVQWPTTQQVPSSTKSTLVMLASTLLSLPFDDGRSGATLYLFTLQLPFWGNCTDTLFPFTWTVAIDWLGGVDDNDDDDGGNDNNDDDGGNEDVEPIDGDDCDGDGGGGVGNTSSSSMSEIDAAEFERG